MCVYQFGGVGVRRDRMYVCVRVHVAVISPLTWNYGLWLFGVIVAYCIAGL